MDIYVGEALGLVRTLLSAINVKIWVFTPPRPCFAKTYNPLLDFWLSIATILNSHDIKPNFIDSIS